VAWWIRSHTGHATPTGTRSRIPAIESLRRGGIEQHRDHGIRPPQARLACNRALFFAVSFSFIEYSAPTFSEWKEPGLGFFELVMLAIVVEHMYLEFLVSWGKDGFRMKLRMTNRQKYSEWQCQAVLFFLLSLQLICTFQSCYLSSLMISQPRQQTLFMN